MVLTMGVIALAGCGDDDASSGGGAGGSADDKEAITRVIKSVIANDVEVECVKAVTKDFVQRVYGDVAQCRKAEKPDKKDDENEPDDAKASDIKIDGPLATAKIRLIGGDIDGTEGTLELRKQDGQWRIDDLGVDLLRSQIKQGLAQDTQDNEALRQPVVRDCTQKAFDALSDDELKRVAYLAIAERKESETELAKVILPCLSKKGSGEGSGDVSFLREKFEQGIRESAGKDGTSKATIDCIIKELRTTISDKEIAGTASGKSTPALNRKVADAVRGCQGEAPSES